MVIVTIIAAKVLLALFPDHLTWPGNETKVPLESNKLVYR